ncbi:MAG: TIR domain-containing protein [Clostridiales Family XIII bacterium]|nr:TIR domain-containing protein [Clostridiales Family XIII bacterium]
MGETGYTAFISYRHKPLDTAVAKAIHRQIEAYRVPAHIAKASGRKRMGRLFRDQEELPLLADLGAGIRQALADSEWLILICSPDLPKSKWCMAEVDYFIELGRRDRILAVLAGGEPEDSFPPQLRFQDIDGKSVEIEPLAADVRAAGAGASVGKVRGEKLRLIAPMLGVGYDDLRRRQRERFLRRLAVISVCVAAFSLAAGAYVLNQNALIARQRSEALISQSKFLSGISAELLAAGDPATAALLALEALPADLDSPDRPLTDAAASALRNARASRAQGEYTLTGGVSAAFYNDWAYLEKDRALSFNDNGRQLFYHMPSGRLLGEAQGTLEAHCPERSIVAVSRLIDEKKRVALYDLVDLAEPLIEITGPDIYHGVSFTAGGRYLVRSLTGSASSENFIELLETDSGKSVFRMTERDLLPDADLEKMFGRPYMSVAAVSPDGKSLAVSIGRAEAGMAALKLYDLPSGKEGAAPEYELSDGTAGYWQAQGPDQLAFSPDGRFLGVTDGKGATHIILAASGKRVASLPPPEGLSESYQLKAAFSPDSRWLALWASDLGLAVYRAETGEPVALPGTAPASVDYAGFTGECTLVLHRGAASDELIVLPLDAPGRQYAVSIPQLQADPAVLTAALANRGVAAHADGFTAFSGRGAYQLWEHSPGSAAAAGQAATGTGLAAGMGGAASASDLRRFAHALSDYDAARAFSPDGRRFAVSIEGVVRVFDTDTLSELAAAEAEAGEDRTRQLLWLPDGERLLSVSRRGDVRVLDAATGAVLHAWDAAYTNSPFATVADLSPDGRLFVLNNPSQIGGMYDLDGYEKLYGFTGVFEDNYRQNALGFTAACAFSPDGSRLYLGIPPESGEPPFELAAVEPQTGDVLKRFTYCPEYGMAVSADGRKIAFGTSALDRAAPRAFVVLDTETGTELWRADTELGIRGVVAFSPDGAFVAASDTNDGRTTVWDAATGAVQQLFTGYDPVFSPDSSALLISDTPALNRNAADRGNESALYDIRSGSVSAKLPLPGVFSPDGGALLMQDRIWYSKPLETLMREAREQLGGRSLTDDERRRFYLD